MILSEKAKALRQRMPERLKLHLVESVAFSDVLARALETDDNFQNALRDIMHHDARRCCCEDCKAALLSLAAYISDALKSAHVSVSSDACDDEADYLASILDNSEELAAYRKLRDGLLE